MGRISDFRHFVAGLVAASLLVTGCSGGTSPAARPSEPRQIEFHADYPEYSTLGDAVSASDAVVLVTIVESREELLPPEVPKGGSAEENPQLGVDADEGKDELSVPITVARVKVTQVLKGSVKVGSTVDVMQLGGAKNGVQYREGGTVLLGEAEGNQFLLLLRSQGRRFDLINPMQGAWIRDGQSLKALDGGTDVPFGVTNLDKLTIATAER